MRVKALTSFAGKVSMYEGEVKEVNDRDVRDLLAAGYVAEVKTEAKPVEKPVENSKPAPKKTVEKSTRKKKK